MQSTESRVGHDFQTDFSFHRVSSRRCVLHQSEMSAVLVVITDIFGEQSSQVPFLEGNHVIQEIAAAAPYPALGDTVLPRATDRRSDRGESYGGDPDATARIAAHRLRRRSLLRAKTI